MSIFPAVPSAGVGIAALTDPSDGLDRLQWLLDHDIRSTQIALAQRFGLWPATLSGSRRRRLARQVDQLDRPVIHAPFASVADITFISPSPGVVEGSLRELESVLAVANDVGVRDVVVHSGVKVSWMKDSEASELFRRSLDAFSRLAGRYDVTLAIENAEWLNASPGLARLVLDAGDPRLRLCLDIGHFLTPLPGTTPLGGYVDILALIAERGGQATVVHIHDTDGRRDHRPLGANASLDIASIVGALARSGFAGPYIQELSPRELSHERLLASTRYLEGVIDGAYATA